MSAAKNTQKVIQTGFISILVFFGVLTFLSVHRLLMDHFSLNVTSQYNEALQNLFIMRDATARRALILYRMSALKDPFKRDELYLEFISQGERFIKSRLELSRQDKLSGFLEQYRSIQPLLRQASQMNENVIQLIRAEQYDDANKLLQNKMLILQDKVTTSLSNIVNQLRKQTDKNIKQASRENYHAIYLIIAISLAIFSIVSIIALYVLRKVKKNEELILKQKQLAEAASQSKTNFLANMSHEIRTPLTAIIGFSENIVIDDDLSRDGRIKVSNSILRNGRHLLQLINNILDISKIEAGELLIESVETSPVNILAQINSIVSAQTAKKNLSFNIHYNFPLPEFINTDPVCLKQILINLCGNAIKFTEQGSINISIQYDKNNAHLSFIVTDTGIGMTEKSAQNIFAKFTQAESSTTRKYGGTGLGLAISRQLAEALNGTLTCKSIAGKGSQFKLDLALNPADKINLIQEPQSKLASDEYQQEIEIPQLTGKILLAEDSKDNQELISMYISKTGAELTIVEDGEQAVEEGLANNYQLILMDMQMPNMDGVTAIKLLRAAGYRRAIVSLTANAMQSDKDKCLNSGANNYIVKPVDVNKFYSILKQYLKLSEHTLNASYADDNPDRMKKLTAKFLESLPEKISIIDESFTNENWELLDTASHKLKGLGGAFGYPEITSLAKDINEFTRSKNYAELSKPVKELVKLCRKILTEDAA